MKGQKTGGRVVGSVNFTKKQTKEMLVSFMQDKFEEIQVAFERLDDLNKVKIYFSLIKYIIPTITSIKMEDKKNDDEVLKKFLKDQS